MAFLGFLIAAAYWPGISGAANAPRWALVSVAVPFLFPDRVRLTTGHVALILLVVWAALSLAWSPQPLDAIPALWVLVLVLGAFCIGGELQSLRPVYIGMALGLGVNSVAAIAQEFYGWAGVAQFSVPAGLFVNPIMLGELSALVIVALVAERIWWAIPFIVPSIVLAGARGPALALILGLVFVARNKAVTVLLLVSIAIAPLVIAHRPDSIAERFAIWRDTIDGMTLKGSGIGSFYSTYPATATRTDTLKSRPKHAHNDLLELAYELGLLGLLGVVAFALALCRGVARTEQSVLVAFFVCAMFGFPAHMPATAFLAALAAGRVCGTGPVLRDDIARWRILLRARHQGTDQPVRA